MVQSRDGVGQPGGGPRGADNPGCILKADPRECVVSLHVDTETLKITSSLLSVGTIRKMRLWITGLGKTVGDVCFAQVSGTQNGTYGCLQASMPSVHWDLGIWEV